MTISDDRLRDLIRFYEILDMLAERIGGPRILAECTGRMGWPERGVYFFPGRHPCAQNRLQNDTLATAFAAPWIGQDRRREPQGLHIPPACWHRTVCDQWDDGANLGARQFCHETSSGEREATGKACEQNHWPDAVFVARGSGPTRPGQPPRLHRAQCHRPAQQLQQPRTRSAIAFLAWHPLQPGKGSCFRTMEPESCR